MPTLSRTSIHVGYAGLPKNSIDTHRPYQHRPSPVSQTFNTHFPPTREAPPTSFQPLACARRKRRSSVVDGMSKEAQESKLHSPTFPQPTRHCALFLAGFPHIINLVFESGLGTGRSLCRKTHGQSIIQPDLVPHPPPVACFPRRISSGSPDKSSHVPGIADLQHILPTHARRSSNVFPTACVHSWQAQIFGSRWDV